MPAELDACQFESFLRGDDPGDRMHRQITPIIRNLARRFAPDFRAERIDEVVNETYVLLLDGDSTRFDAAEGPVSAFVRGKVKTAAERVRATYVAPGCRTRVHRRGISSAQAPSYEQSAGDGDGSTLEDANWRRSFDWVEASHDYAAVIGSNEALVVAALIGIYIRGEAIAAVASRLGVSRFRINREINRVRLKFTRGSAAACRSGRQ